MSAVINMDVTNIDPNGVIEPVPAGWYTVVIDESEMKPTKAPGGYYLGLEMSIIEGPHKGQKIFDNLNLRNANETAQRIGIETLSAIGHAVGVLQIGDSAQLHGKPLQCKVRVNPADDQYEARNEVRGYKAVEKAGEVAAPAVQAPAPVAPAEPAAAAGEGWQAPAEQAWEQPAAPAPAPAPAPQPAAQPAAQPAPAAGEQPAWAAAPTEQPAQAAPAPAAPAEEAAPMGEKPDWAK